MSKPIECTTPRVNPNVSYELWVKTPIAAAWASTEVKTRQGKPKEYILSSFIFGPLPQSESLTWVSCTGPQGPFALSRYYPLSLFTGI